MDWFTSNIVLLIAVLLHIVLTVITNISPNRRNQKSITRSFTLLSLGFALWIASNIFIDSVLTESLAILWTRLSGVGIVFVACGFAYFSIFFPDEHRFGPRSLSLLNLAMAILFILVLLFSNNLIAGVNMAAFPREVLYGPLYPFLVAFLLFNTFYVLYNFISKYRKVSKKYLMHFRYIIIGFTLTIAFTITFNLVLPNLGITDATRIGPLSTVFFGIAVSIAIFKHRLFSIRLIISTVIRYILTTSLLGIMFILTIAILLFYRDSSSALLMVILAVTMFVVSTIITIKGDHFFLRFVKSRLLDYDIDYVKNLFSLDIEGQLNTLEIHKSFYRYISKSVGIKKIYYIKEIRNASSLLDIEDFKSIKLSKTTDFEIKNEERNIVESVSELRGVDKDLMLRYDIEYRTRLLGVKDDVGIVLYTTRSDNVALFNEDVDLITELSRLYAVALERAFLYEEVQKFSQTLQAKVDAATIDLKEKNATLQQLRDKERDMMDIMGHELRTPLTIIKMTLGIIKAKSDAHKARFEPKEFNEYHKRLREAADREVNLLETMLSSTKLDAKRMEIHLEKVDLLPMIKDSILAHEDKATDKGLKLIFDHTNEPIEVFADRIRLPEVVDNLVNNAIKYTDKGTVTIKVNGDKKFVHFAVIDTGRGIPKDALPRLGTKFFRVKQHLEKVHNNDQSNNIVRPGGTGLGLYVTFGLLELMGGSIKVESEFGKGSTFTALIQRYDGQQEEGAVETHKDVFARLGLSKEEVLKERAKLKKEATAEAKAAKAELNDGKMTEADNKSLARGSSNSEYFKKAVEGEKDSGKNVAELLEEKA